MTDAVGSPLVALVRAHESLGELAAAINASHAQALATFKKGAELARDVGELLTRAKVLCPDGQWGKWVETNCHFKPRMARRYIQVYEQWNDIQTAVSGTASTAQDQTIVSGTGGTALGINRALAILAGPEPEELQAAQMGTAGSHLAPDAPPTTRPLEPDEYVPQWDGEGDEQHDGEHEDAPPEDEPEPPADVPVTNAIAAPLAPAPSASRNRSASSAPPHRYAELSAKVTALTREVAAAARTDEHLRECLRRCGLVFIGAEDDRLELLAFLGVSALLEAVAQGKSASTVKNIYDTASGGFLPPKKQWHMNRAIERKRQRAEGGS